MGDEQFVLLQVVSSLCYCRQLTVYVAVVVSNCVSAGGEPFVLVYVATMVSSLC